MRFLIEIEQRAIVPVVIQADTEEGALEIFRSTPECELAFGDPIPQPAAVKSIKKLGE